MALEYLRLESRKFKATASDMTDYKSDHYGTRHSLLYHTVISLGLSLLIAKHTSAIRLIITQISHSVSSSSPFLVFYRRVLFVRVIALYGITTYYMLRLSIFFCSFASPPYWFCRSILSVTDDVFRS